jgi:hypothetical protein
VWRAVQIDQLLIHHALLDRLDAGQLGSDLVQHCRDRALDASTEVTAGLTVAQLHRLVFPGGRTGGHRRTGQRAVIECHFDLDSGVPARVQNLAGSDLFDDGHGCAPCQLLGWDREWLT